MRSRRCHTINSGQVQRWAVEWLLQAELLKCRGPKCTAVVVWGILLRAASRMISIYAACSDLADAPSEQALLNALEAGLPKTLPALERRLNEALIGVSARTLRRRRWELAIDWHLVPYYGRPYRSRNELYYGKPRPGTSKFHAYATACIVSRGHRYTLAVTWVRRHETTIVVLERLLQRIRDWDVKIRCILLDRAFFNVPVIEFLQARRWPFLMPVMYRGRRPKHPRSATGLRAIQRRAIGWYAHTMKNRGHEVSLRVCVTNRTYRCRSDGRCARQKLLFAASRISGSPRDLSQRYRQRFGIESSYRQARQAKIHTCVRNPHLRLVFFVMALLLRNLWVWIHLVHLATRRGAALILHLERLRFKRLLDWINQAVVTLFHNNQTTCAQGHT